MRFFERNCVVKMSDVFSLFFKALKLSTKKSKTSRQTPNTRFLIIFFLVQNLFSDFLGLF